MAFEILRGQILSNFRGNRNPRRRINAGFAQLNSGLRILGYKNGDIPIDEVRGMLLARSPEEAIIDFGEGSEIVYDPLQALVTITPRGESVPLTPQENRVLTLLTGQPYEYHHARELFLQENLELSCFYDWNRAFRVHTFYMRRKLGNNTKGDPYVRSDQDLGYGLFPGTADLNTE